ncbi:MAG: ECF transporter S component [Candidatus Thorarchaeota archaeon]
MDTHGELNINRSKRVSIIAMMTALALVGNYTLVMIPNVELGSSILFVTSYIFGFSIGASCAVIMAIVFGSINPWGIPIPEILITQILGWLYIVAAGSLMGTNQKLSKTTHVDVLRLGAAGVFLTLFFELLTNFGYAIAFGLPYWVTILTGIPFTVVHVVSNAIIFAAATPRLDNIIKTQFESYIWETSVEVGLLSEE